MIVAVTIGHAGRPSKLKDRGAVYENIEEVTLVRRYTDALDQHLRKLGHDCILLSDGPYSDQWARADAYGAQVYLNCHVNAGGGDHALLLHDHRSVRGMSLAESIVPYLSSVFGPASSLKVKVAPCRPDTNGTPRDADYSEAFGTISGVRAVALCLEPYFIDGPRRAKFITELPAFGQAIAMGIDAWGKTGVR